MDISLVILTIQVIVSILLIILILAQAKDGGLSTVMGGSGQSFQAEKRGPEKVIYRMTIFLAAIFLINAFLMLIF